MKRLVAHLPLAVLLGLALLARLALVARGGQLFWHDEVRRFFAGCQADQRLLEGDLGGALRELLNADCPAFAGFVALVGLVPAKLGASTASVARIVAAVLAGASVGVVALVHALARRCGAGRREAFAAAFLAATSLALEQWARHVVPYDLGLALVLASLWVGLGGNDRRRAFLAGVLGGVAALVYDGGWAGVAVAALTPLVVDRRVDRRDLARRSAATFAGLVAPVVVAAGAGLLAGATPLWRLLRTRAGTVTQGAFDEGWSLPWEYLGTTEGLLLGVLACGAAAAIARRRGTRWLVVAGALYALLAGASRAHVFVVYGRGARQLVPFLCLAAATPLARTRSALLRVAVCGVAVVLVLRARDDWRSLEAMDFPGDVLARVAGTGEPVEYGCTVSAVIAPLRARSAPGARLLLLNAQPLYPIEAPRPAPRGRVIYEAPHPNQHRALRFDGYTAAERAILATDAATMRLIDRSR